MEQGAALFDLVCVDPELLDGFRGVDGLRAFVVLRATSSFLRNASICSFRGGSGCSAAWAPGAVRPRQQVLQLWVN